MDINSSDPATLTNLLTGNRETALSPSIAVFDLIKDTVLAAVMILIKTVMTTQWCYVFLAKHHP